MAFEIEKQYAPANRDYYSSSSLLLEKPLPASPEAEKTLLGAILLDNNLMAESILMIKETDFYNPFHRHLYAAMVRLHQRGKKIDPILLKEEMTAVGIVLETYGGIKTINDLTWGLPHFSSVEIYAEIIKEKSDLRQQVKILSNALSEVLSEERKAREIAATTASELVLIGKDISKPRKMREVVKKVRERFHNWLTADEKTLSIPSSIPELNAALRYNGYTPSDLIMIAARPSIGKSALMLDSAAAAAAAGFGTLVFSLEMSNEDLAMRMLPQRAGVRNMDIKPALYRRNAEVRKRVDDALTLIETLPIEFDSESMILEDIFAKIEIGVRKNGIKIIFLDFLQLMKATSRNRRRDLELEEICSALKAAAKRFNIPIVCLAQLNRNADNEDRRPEMQDVREAGASEQIVDVLIMPYRAASRRKERKGATVEATENEPVVQVNLFMAKQRNGAAGFDIKTDFDMDYQRFMSHRLWLEDRLDKFTME